MTRLRDVCWTCDGEGHILQGDCPNCNGTGLAQTEMLAPIEEVMLDVILGKGKWELRFVEPLRRYYFLMDGEPYFIRTWSITDTYVRWTLYLEEEHKKSCREVRDGTWIYQNAHSNLAEN